MRHPLTPSKTHHISKHAALTRDQEIFLDNTLLYTVHASTGVFHAPSLTIYDGKSKGSVLATAKLDKGNAIAIAFPGGGGEVVVSVEGVPGDAQFRFRAGGRELVWRHTRAGEVIVADGLGGGGVETEGWDWKLVPVLSTGVETEAGTDDVLGLFYHDSARGGSGAARVHWFGGGERVSAQEELVALAVVLALEERARRGQMFGGIGDANVLAGKAAGYGAW